MGQEGGRGGSELERRKVKDVQRLGWANTETSRTKILKNCLRGRSAQQKARNFKCNEVKKHFFLK